jgi:hypothetical protein
MSITASTVPMATLAHVNIHQVDSWNDILEHLLCG